MDGCDHGGDAVEGGRPGRASARKGIGQNGSCAIRLESAAAYSLEGARKAISSERLGAKTRTRPRELTVKRTMQSRKNRFRPANRTRQPSADGKNNGIRYQVQGR